MTRIFIVRHGEAEGNINNHCHGQYDSNLTPKGKKQIMLTAQTLSDVAFDAVYASDLKRACETARPIAEGHGLPIIKRKELREIDVGDWDDKDWEFIDEKYHDAYELWKNQPELMQAPNGESMVQMRERIKNAVLSIVRENPDKTVCVVSHCCAIKNFICWCKGQGIERLNDQWICNASYSIIDFDGDIPYIVSLNNVEQLEELGYISTPPWVN